MYIPNVTQSSPFTVKNSKCKHIIFDMSKRGGFVICNKLITVCVKRNAHLIRFFVAPLGEGGQKFTWSIMYSHLHNPTCEYLARLPQASHKKKIGIKCAFLLT